MVVKREQHLFAPGKVEWMLNGGLETMQAGERQMLLVMAETQIQDGYKPTGDEKKVVEGLRALAGDDYDAKDIKRKVKTMVKGRRKTDTPPLHLPPVFDRLLSKFRKPDSE
jgi:hypothetical protein